MHNIPEATNEEIKQFFHTFLVTLNPSNAHTSPVASLEKFEGYYLLELYSSDDIEILINIDLMEWRGHRMRIERLPIFFRKYNSTKGENVRYKTLKRDLNSGLLLDSENKIFLTGIPTFATEEELRVLAESFGIVKLVNLIRDNTDDTLNRGFCFIEYENKIGAEKAIDGFNNIEFLGKKLKAQKANMNQALGKIATDIKEGRVISNKVPNKFSENIESATFQSFLPEYARTPSRLLVMINMLSPEDLMDENDYRDIEEEIRSEVVKYGTVISLEIIRPCIKTYTCSPAVGKVFVRYQNVSSAVKARYKISGLKFNRRTVVCSFYPEDQYDQRILCISENLDNYHSSENLNKQT